MQALRPLSAASFGAHHSQHDRLACATPHVFGDAAVLQQLKRKRADSTLDNSPQIDTCPPPAKKSRETSYAPSSSSSPSSVLPPSLLPSLAEQSSGGTQEIMPSTCTIFPSQRPSQRTSIINLSKLDRAKQKIESQINLEILHRHNELRLIDQEIAKVQIALEQIRRCQVVPYPGQQGASGSAYGASTGAGMPLQPSPGFSTPQHPPAFGITDSPYGRHYQQWLLPDDKFDSVPIELMHPPVEGKSYFPEGRSTRGFGERSSFAASRSQRHSHISSHQSLPNHYPVAKQQAGPLIIRRLSDQQMVKLVCVWCQKENISSVQGFLNHCRIAHGENFASHEQAAQKCGQPLEGEPLSTPTTAAPPVIATTPTVATPTIASSPVASVLVHPLVNRNRSGETTPAANSLNSTPSRPSPLQSSFSESAPIERPRPVLNIPLGDPKAFVPSQHTPYLSAMMKKIGSGHDLEQLVALSKTKINLDDVQPLASPETEDVPHLENSSKAVASTAPVSRSHATPIQTSRTSPGPTATTLKGMLVPPPINASTSQPRLTPNATIVGSPRSPNTPGSPGDASVLSGGIDTSHDSNPGLVSDHDGESSDSDSEECHATATRRRSFDIQVRGQGDSLDEQIVAGLAEEHETMTCAIQPHPATAQPQHQGNESPSEPMSGRKRKRGRPSKAESREKVRGE